MYPAPTTDRVAQGQEELTIVPTLSIESRGVFSADRIASAEQCELVRLAAKLVKRILKS
jgi:hypothetical protein